MLCHLLSFNNYIENLALLNLLYGSINSILKRRYQICIHGLYCYLLKAKGNTMALCDLLQIVKYGEGIDHVENILGYL